MNCDRAGAQEIGLSIAGAGAEACSLLPSTEFLLRRLDLIDVRLRQLEKQRFPPESSYFAADLHSRQCSQHLPCKSLSSALHEVHHKGTLMDRLHLLECQIRQLGYELEKEGTSISSSASAIEISCENPLLVAAEHKMNLSSTGKIVVRESKRNGEILHRGARELQGQISNKIKAKGSSREAMKAVEKRASSICKNEKRRQEHARIYRKWFPVGC